MHRVKARGFTLIELLVVIAIIAILAAILFPVFVTAKEKGRQCKCATQCRQIAIAIVRYADDNNNWIVKSADPNHTINTPQGQRSMLWNDILKPYIRSRDFQICPSRSLKKVTSISDLEINWGLGVSHPTICGFWDSERKRMPQIRRPSKTLVAGDVARVTNPTRPPDDWIEGEASFIFRTPANGTYYTDYASGAADHIIGRHNGRANCVFLDGHAQSMKPSELGFQYAEGDARALWDIY
jgi:prepilin-type N-terminal cleavage/methylation domain-containing protein/prepilin-type processing-associated H-X9-DG protein